MPDLAPLVREVIVPAAPALAFDVFTARVGTWWPLDSHSVHGVGSVAFEDGELVETAPDGSRSVWGTLTAWDPPERVAFTWHPGRGPDAAAHVTVTFTEHGDGTLVRLEHTGWEVYADPVATRDEYGEGWVFVLGRYGAAVA